MKITPKDENIAKNTSQILIFSRLSLIAKVYQD